MHLKNGFRLKNLLMCATAVVAATAVSCSREESAAPEEFPGDAIAAEVFGSRAALKERVAAILQRTKEATSEQPASGQEPTRLVPLPRQLPQTDPIAPIPARPGRPEDPGATVLTLEAPPRAFALDNDGRVLYSDRQSTWLASPSGSLQELMKGTASTLQLDATGQRLLLQTPEQVFILDGRNWENVRRLDRTVPEGHAQWSAEDENQLLFIREAVIFDANEKERVFLEVQGWDLNAASAVPLAWSPFRKYSALGTLPAAGLVWAHPMQPYQILPLPGPLLEIEEGEQKGMLTSPEGALDRTPSADTNGTLYWMRTWQRNGNESSRGFFRSASGDEHQFTSSPTHAVAVSPDGDSAGFVIASGGRYEAKTISVADLAAMNDLLKQIAAADVTLRVKAENITAAVQREFAAAGLNALVRESEYGWTLLRPPSMDETRRMGQALGTAVAEEFAPLVKGLPGLEQADRLLRELAPYLEESPSMVIALGGLLLNVLPEEDVRWSLGTSGESAPGQDVKDMLWTDGLTLTAVDLFGAARERISGQQSLHTLAERLLTREERPLHMVENLREETLSAARMVELKAAGINLQRPNPRQLLEALQKDPLNDALFLSASQTEMPVLGEEIRLIASCRLSEANPASPRALEILGGVLNDNLLLPEAAEVLQMAVLLDPLNPSLHFDLADTYLLLDRLREAEAEFLRAQELDTLRSLEELLQGRLRVVRELQEENGE